MAKAKGLNALKRIKQGKFVTCNICDATMHEGCLCCAKHLAKCKDLVTIQKELQAFDIIRKKSVSIERIFPILKKYTTVDYYNNLQYIWTSLTQEEFDLLKEVLNND